MAQLKDAEKRVRQGGKQLYKFPVTWKTDQEDHMLGQTRQKVRLPSQLTW
jgi:hypothetical protein